MGKPVTSDEKLDKIVEQGIDTRLALATLHGEVRSVTLQLAAHEAARLDFEQRLRALERRSYALPSLATLVGLAGLGVAVWSKLG